MKSKLTLIFGLLFAIAILTNCEDDAVDEHDEAFDDAEDDDVGSPDIEEENGVLVLTEDNFDDAIASNENILVEFYAPWCGHCKSLAPEYEKAATSLKGSDPPAVLAKVDATVHGELGSRFGVSGYPTLKFFKNGEPTDYDGPREAQGIEDWMLQHTDPSWKPPPDAVVALTTDTFTDFINEHDLSLVEFYAPWCGHCKKLAPEYSAAAKFFQENTDPPIMLAKVDATEERDLGTQFDVTGYPTLIMFRKGRQFEYKGGRDKNGIIEHMMKQQGDASQERASVHNVKSSVLKDDITVFGFFENAEAPAYQVYQDAASELREDFTLYHSFDGETRKEFRVNPNSLVVFYAEQFHSKHEPKWRTYEITEDTKSEELVKFIQEHSISLVGELTTVNQEKRYADKRPLIIFFYMVDFGFDYRDATQLWRKKIVEIAKDYKDSLTFAVADDEKMTALFKEFGFEDSGEEMNIGILDDKGRKFPMEPMDEFDQDEIRSFIKKFKAGKLKPRIKSQPVPKKNAGPVITVVGKTFEEIVLKNDKEVFIEFYAPWCGHCKKLDPVWKELGKKFKKEKNIVIAKIDATANEAPASFETTGFPTIFWVPRNNKDSPIKYDGGRELKELVDYVEENSKTLKKKAKKEEL